MGTRAKRPSRPRARDKEHPENNAGKMLTRSRRIARTATSCFYRAFFANDELARGRFVHGPRVYTIFQHCCAIATVLFLRSCALGITGLPLTRLPRVLVRRAGSDNFSIVGLAFVSFRNENEKLR